MNIYIAYLEASSPFVKYLFPLILCQINHVGNLLAFLQLHLQMNIGMERVDTVFLDLFNLHVEI